MVFFCGPSNKSVDVVARKCKFNWQTIELPIIIAMLRCWSVFLLHCNFFLHKRQIIMSCFSFNIFKDLLEIVDKL